MSLEHRYNGFPLGYFTIQSLASNDRVWDVEFANHRKGAPVILFPPKNHHHSKGHYGYWKSPINHSGDQYGKGVDESNQIFYIDESGALCSEWAGHAVEVHFDNIACHGYLGLQHRRLMVHPPMMRSSYPGSVFEYSAETGHIEVTVHSDTDILQTSNPSSPLEKPKKYMIRSIAEPKHGLTHDLIDLAQHVYPAGRSPVGGPSGKPRSAMKHRNEPFDVHAVTVCMEDDDHEENTRRLEVFDSEQYQALKENDKKRCKFLIHPVAGNIEHPLPQHRSTVP